MLARSPPAHSTMATSIKDIGSAWTGNERGRAIRFEGFKKGLALFGGWGRERGLGFGNSFSETAEGCHQALWAQSMTSEAVLSSLTS